MKGALIRSSFLHLEEMDAPGSFFFSLERSAARREQISYLQLLDSRTTTGPGGDERSDQELLQQLGADPLSLESHGELLEMTPGRATEMDNLSADVLRHLWPVLGRELKLKLY